MNVHACFSSRSFLFVCRSLHTSYFHLYFFSIMVLPSLVSRVSSVVFLATGLGIPTSYDLLIKLILCYKSTLSDEGFKFVQCQLESGQLHFQTAVFVRTCSPKLTVSSKARWLLVFSLSFAFSIVDY